MFPPAIRGVPAATTYGPLPKLGLPLALVYHTTETASWPGYNLGLVAPHYSYKATTREWRWHGAGLNRYVGTMRSSRRTGTPANEKSIQVEIIAYSDRSIADKRASRIWVGDFEEHHYQDLAAFAAWASGEAGIRLDHVTSEPKPGGWKSGSGSPFRLDRQDWLDFDGISAHGAVTGQTHWDTGVLGLDRIARYARDLASPPILEDEMLPLKYGDGFADGQTLTYPVGHPQAGASFTTDRFYKRSDVRAIQGVLRDAGASVNTDGAYTVKTAQAIMDVTPGTGADSNGFEFHGNDFAPTFKAAYGGSSGGGGDLSRGDTVTLN